MAVPRLLTVANPDGARRELLAVGCDPSGIERMADKMVGRLVKVPQLPCRAAQRLQQELRALGGDVARARGSETGSPVTDVILIGTLQQLRQLTRGLASQPFGLAALGQELAELLAHLDHPGRILAGSTCRLEIDRPLIMGILNVAPDSFSDGGSFSRLPAALAHARQLMAEGADLIDVGGESTRPGAPPVTVAEELARVVPVIEALTAAGSVPISIDTTKAEVARAALAAGAEFVNDISGFTFDEELPAVTAAAGAGAFLMHTRGLPAEMQRETRYRDLIGEVLAGLSASLTRARQAGIPEEKLAIDPGIGFGKDVAGNLEILRRLPEFLALGRPLLLGTSRKSFIGKILDQADPLRRLHGTLATVALGVAGGARIFRVHDVGPAREAAQMAWAISREPE